MHPDNVMMAMHRFFATGHGIACQERALRMAYREIAVSELAGRRASDHCTWRARNSVWVSLIKRSNGKTAILFHQDGYMSDAAPSCSLSDACPVDSVFVGQAILDNDGGHLRPSILLFDVTEHGGTSLSEQPASKRYSILRQGSEHYFHNTSVSVQWVGNGSAAVEFGRSAVLPHAVDYVFSIPERTDEYTLFIYDATSVD